MVTLSLASDQPLALGCRPVSELTAASKTSYEALPIWRDLQRFFPADHQIPHDQLPHEQTFLWRDCAVHVDQYCNPDSRFRIILHHGLGTNARLMSMIVGHALSKLGYDVAALDMPYVGATRTPHSRFIYSDWMQLSSDYINCGCEHDDRPVVLFGFSVGGLLSYQVSCVNEKVKAVSATCFIDLTEKQVRQAIAQRPFCNAILERIGEVLLRVGLRPSFSLKSFADASTISNDPAFNHLIASDPTSMDGDFPLTFLDSLRHQEFAVKPQDYDKCPIALFQSEFDRNIPPEINLKFFQRLSGQKCLQVLPGAGHIPLNTEALKELADGLNSFIGKIK